VRSYLDDPETAEKRIDELRRLARDADEGLLGFELDAPEMDVASGYGAWAATYDVLPNPLIRVEEPVVRAMIDELPVGRALDAACGTGRHAAYLRSRGWEVLGIDQSPEMLEKAADRVRGMDFRIGDLARLPVESASVDLAVCALALQHVPDLGPPIAELARVVRPGGHVVLSEFHPMMTALGGKALFARGDGSYALVRSYIHSVGGYLSAARATGLEIERCVEPVWAEVDAQIMAGPLFPLAPDAFRGAFVGLPGAIIWRFRRP